MKHAGIFLMLRNSELGGSVSKRFLRLSCLYARRKNNPAISRIPNTIRCEQTSNLNVSMPLCRKRTAYPCRVRSSMLHW